MKLLENILNKLLLKESVSVNDVEDAINNHKRVIINYRSKGEDSNTGARVVEVYAYGLTKAGNPCIRCFQPMGDTTSRVPSWKLFRLDRISAWKPTRQTFSRPADFFYKGLGEFNPNGDETMSVVYKIAQFNDNNNTEPAKDGEMSGPKLKTDVYKTDTERNLERFRQQTMNPIYLSDIKQGDAFKQLNNTQVAKAGPKTKEDVNQNNSEENNGNLAQQTQIPKTSDLQQTKNNPNDKSREEKENELEKLRQILSDKPMTLADLSKLWKDSQTDKEKRDNINMRRRDKRWMDAVDKRHLGNRKGSLNRAFEEDL